MHTQKDHDSISFKYPRPPSSDSSSLTSDKHQGSQIEPAATQSLPSSPLRPPGTRHSSLSVPKNCSTSAIHETNMSLPILRDGEATRKLLEIIKDTPNGSRTVARLARTCKAFQEPATKVLWSELDSFLPLIGLFPAYILKKPRMPHLGLVRPVSHALSRWRKVAITIVALTVPFLSFF